MQEIKAVLIGEAPSKGGDRYASLPLSGRPARVLCELAGIPPVPDGTTWGRWTWALGRRLNDPASIARAALAGVEPVQLVIG